MKSYKNSVLKIISNILVVLLISVNLISPARAQSVKVIEGTSKYDTASKLTSLYYESADSAVLVSADSYPDSLVGGVLADYENSPILTINKDKLAEDALSQIERLNVDYAYILGGENTSADKSRKRCQKKDTRLSDLQVRVGMKPQN